MSRVNHLIRQAAVQVLLNAGVAGDRVTGSRVKFLNTDIYPCVLVSTGRERAEIQGESPRSYKRNLPLQVEIKQRVTLLNALTIEDDLDILGREVELLLNGDQELGQSVNLAYEGSDPSFSGRGKLLYAHMVLEFDAEHITESPETDGLQSFATAGLEVDTVGSIDDAIEISRTSSLDQ